MSFPDPRAAVAALALAALVLAPAGRAAAQEDAPPARDLRVGTKVVRPFAFRDAEDRWTGLSIDLWKEIGRRNGWRWTWVEAPNTNDLVDMVARGEVDVGIAAITMKPERAEIVDFSNSMFESGLGIATRVEAGGTFGSLRVLASSAFLKAIAGLSALLLAVGLLVWLFERRRNEAFEPGPGGLWSGFWFSAVTMTTVGYGDKAPRTVGGRIVTLVWMYASILFISSFTAVIASSLTTRQLASRVRGEEDLAEVRVGAKTGESPAEILAARGIRAIPFESIEGGLAAVADGRIEAFVHDAPVLKYEILERPERLKSVHVLPKVMRAEEYGIAVRPTEERNRLVDEINRALLEVKISGRYQEISESWLGR